MKNVLLINCYSPGNFLYPDKIVINNGITGKPLFSGELTRLLTSKITDYINNKQEYKLETTIIENGYDIREELEKFDRANFIIFQTPAHWHSLPAKAKQYFDDMFINYEFIHDIVTEIWEAKPKGLDYGMNLKKNPDKKRVMLSTTWYAPADAFSDKTKFFRGLSADDFFAWIRQSCIICGFDFGTNYHLTDAYYEKIDDKIPELLQVVQKNLDLL